MPVKKGQGQSHDATEWKERGIAAALNINLQIFKSKFGNKPYAVYQHFDLNAGSGINQEVGCIGSPLAFMQSIGDVGVTNFRAHFVDNDSLAVKQLLNRHQMKHENCFVFHGDNKPLIKMIPDIVRGTENPKFAIGSILVDPNGTDVPVNELAWISNQCPKLDIVVNWNSVAAKRCQGSKGYLIDIINQINKKHWLIREPVGKWQWVMLIGRNMLVSDYKSLGFYDLNSGKGQDIFLRCNHTKEEYSLIANSGQVSLL